LGEHCFCENWKKLAENFSLREILGLEGSLAEAPFSDRPGQPSPLNASKNFGVDRCPVKLRIPKKQKNGASQYPDPTPHLTEASS